MRLKLDYFNFAADIVGRWAQERPGALALWCISHCGGPETKLTFEELDQQAQQAACFFRDAGLTKGCRVLLFLPRIPQWWISMLGLTRLGCVPVPCSQMLTTRELDFRIQAAEINAVVSDTDGIVKFPHFSKIKIQVGGGLPGWLDFDEGRKKASKKFVGERTKASDPGILFFTSATTGDPKMVLHSQTSYGLAHEVTGRLWLDLKPDDIHWNLSDVGWGKAAWSSFFGPWHAGACVFGVDARRFDPAASLNVLAHYPITTWCAPPTAFRMVVREDLSRWKFPHLRHCVSAGEPVNPEILSLWKKATGLTIYEAYGQTETVVIIGNFRSQGFAVKPGSMGKAAPCFQVALVDENGNEVPDGTEGEIAIKTKPERPIGLFELYWKNEEETRAHFRGDWYLTGDRARRDKEGYFWFIGRQDDVIKSSGYRIGPGEVENTILEHPAVLDAAVVGKPDPVRGQIVKAFIVLRPNFRPSEEVKKEIQQYCKKTTAPFKYPREIEIVPSLPKTTSGKTRRFELRMKG